MRNDRGAASSAAAPRRSCSSRRRSRRSHRRAPPSTAPSAGAPGESACRASCWLSFSSSCQPRLRCRDRRRARRVDGAIFIARTCRISSRSVRFASPTMPTSTGIDLADLLRIDVDLNQLRRRNRKRVLRIPRAAVGFAEAGADREDDVGLARRVVGGARAPDAGHAERQRSGPRETRPWPSASSPPECRRARPAPAVRPTLRRASRRCRRRSPAARAFASTCAASAMPSSGARRAGRSSAAARR